MISDVLHEAADEIRSLLSHPETRGAYSDPELRAEINRMVAAMHRLRVRLETPPQDVQPARAKLSLVDGGAK